MARRPRRDSLDGWFHVMNRGAARQRIFHTKHDARQFLALIGEASDRFGVEVHAYCLMPNHFHLLVRASSGQLSRFMQRVGSSYVMYLNERLERDGPLFRGRFHAIPLATLGYVHHVGRYIHRNPVDIRPHVALDAYEWSSYRYYARDGAHPKWLQMRSLLDEHGTRAAYRKYVEGGTRPSGRDRAWKWAVDTAVSEHVDDAVLRTKLGHTVMLSLLDLVDPEDRPAIDEVLDFPTRGARSQALKRMRHRRAESPLVDQIAMRAITLAA